MIKNVWFLFLGVSSLAWSTDVIDKENQQSNFIQKEKSPFIEKNEPKMRENHSQICDNRTFEDIKNRIDFLEGELAEYRDFNDKHYEIIQQLKEINFFNDDFQKGNKDVLDVLESVFTKCYGKGGSWGYIVRELYRRPQRFIQEFDQLLNDVMNRELEKNEEIRNILKEIYDEIGPASFMIAYYLTNKS